MVTFCFKTGDTEAGAMLVPLLIVLLRVRERELLTVKLFMTIVILRATLASIDSLKDSVRQTR
jgi:hypothetical protein